MNKKTKIILFSILGFVVLVLVGLFITLSYFMAPVSDSKNVKKVIIPSGSSFYDIADILEEEDIIKNERFFVYYLKFKRVDNIYAALYYLSPDMTLQEIVDTLEEGGHNPNEISITFKEGINMRQVAAVISENTNNKEEDVLNLLKDTKYLDELIEEYWFLTDDIKNKDIYYSLEGYLFPSTYYLNSKDSEVKEIFATMLNQTKKVLDKYETKIKDSKYNVHEILTIASIIEAEAKYDPDRADVASVFINRLNDGMSLGSDVTTYYANKKDYTSDLTSKELSINSPYNTRNANMAGKLPVGPICNPRESSIEAVLEPNETSYYYFVSDKTGKLYFTKTYSEHTKTISKLKDEGLWLEW